MTLAPEAPTITLDDSPRPAAALTPPLGMQTDVSPIDIPAEVTQLALFNVNSSPWAPLDEHTRAVGHRGVAAAREALRQASANRHDNL